MKKRISMALTAMVLVSALQTEQGAVFAQKEPQAYSVGMAAADVDTREKQALKDYLRGSLENMKPRIDLSGYEGTKESFRAVYEELLEEEAELFFVDDTLFDTVYQENGPQLVPVYTDFKARYSDEIRGTIKPLTEQAIQQMKDMSRQYGQEKQDLIRQMGDFATEKDKALWLYIKLAQRTEYKHQENDGSLYTAYGCIVNRVAACGGYSRAYNDILKDLGLEMRRVLSGLNNHAWSAVRLDGKWYNIDVTRGDVWANHANKLKYHRFLVSQDWLQQQAGYELYWGDKMQFTAKNTFYDNHWIREALDVPMGYADGQWYYPYYKSWNIFANKVMDNYPRTILLKKRSLDNMTGKSEDVGEIVYTTSRNNGYQVDLLTEFDSGYFYISDTGSKIITRYPLDLSEPKGQVVFTADGKISQFYMMGASIRYKTEGDTAWKTAQLSEEFAPPRKPLPVLEDDAPTPEENEQTPQDNEKPVQDEPVQDEPVQDEPVQDEPVQDEPAKDDAGSEQEQNQTSENEQKPSVPTPEASENESSDWITVSGVDGQIVVTQAQKPQTDTVVVAWYRGDTLVSCEIVRQFEQTLSQKQTSELTCKAYALGDGFSLTDNRTLS